MGGALMKVILVNGTLVNIGDWDFREEEIEGELVVTNPLPDGSIEVDRDIAESAKGRLLLADDWHSLRADAYPSIKDQLDAMWKGGVYADEMAEIVQAVKDKYPKPD